MSNTVYIYVLPLTLFTDNVYLTVLKYIRNSHPTFPYIYAP